MAAADDIQASIDQTAALIRQLTLSQQPDISVGGRTYSKGAYLNLLTENLNKFIDLQQRLSAPFEVSTGSE